MWRIHREGENYCVHLFLRSSCTFTSKVSFLLEANQGVDHTSAGNGQQIKKQRENSPCKLLLLQLGDHVLNLKV